MARGNDRQKPNRIDSTSQRRPEPGRRRWLSAHTGRPLRDSPRSARVPDSDGRPQPDGAPPSPRAASSLSPSPRASLRPGRQCAVPPRQTRSAGGPDLAAAFRVMGMLSMAREHVDGNACPSRRRPQEQAAARRAVAVGSGGGCSEGIGGGAGGADYRMKSGRACERGRTMTRRDCILLLALRKDWDGATPPTRSCRPRNSEVASSQRR